MANDTHAAQLIRARVVRAYDVDPSGRVLVGHDATGSMQIYELSSAGDWTQLTDLGESAAGRYVPGGEGEDRRIVVEHDAGGNERGQLSLLTLASPASGAAPAPGSGLPELEPLVHDPAYIHRLVDTQPGRVLFLTNRRDGVEFDLVSRDVTTGEEAVLYDAGGYVMEVAASPDGAWVALTRPAGPANSFQVLLVSTADGSTEEIIDWDTDALCSDPSWLPDSSGFVVSTNLDRDFQGIALVDLADRTPRYLVTDDKHDVAGWPSPDGTRLLVATNDDGAVSVALHSLPGGEHLSTVDVPDVGCVAFHRFGPPIWSADSRFVALTYTSPVEPAYVLRYDTMTGYVTSIRSPEPTALPDSLVLPESRLVPTPDGEQIPTAVYRPVGGGDGSAVLVIHGGPEGQSMREWNPVIQAMAAQGHTVVVPNVRGSSGYGKRWCSLDDVRKRLDSVSDLAALHDWLPTIDVDPARAALYGGSYGGYMVLAGLAFQPERWAAAVDIVGIASLVTFLENTSAYRRAFREREYGRLADDREFLHEASPLTHVDAIGAPLFVIHGANDPRVPLSEAEQICTALVARGIECTLRVYADEGHGLAKVANRLDAYPQALDFLARHLA